MCLFLNVCCCCCHWGGSPDCPQTYPESWLRAQAVHLSLPANLANALPIRLSQSTNPGYIWDIYNT